MAQAQDEICSYIIYVLRLGVHEFDSPTYTATHMASLVKGYRYVAAMQDDDNIKALLDYLWMDLADNYMRSNIRVADPFSRDYDFRNGQHARAWQEVIAGWTSDQDSSGTQILATEGSFCLEGAEMLDSLSYPDGSYQVPKSSYQLSTAAPNHVLAQMWGLPTGSTSGDYVLYAG